MKTLRLIGAAAALAIVAGAAWAGGGCGGCCDKTDFGCQNQCPLAQQANQHRSYGNEGSCSQEALAKQVQKNLAKV